MHAAHASIPPTQVLYNDFNAWADSSEPTIFGRAAESLKRWNELQAELGSGAMQADLKDQTAQVSAASSLMQSVVDAMAGPVSDTSATP